MSISPLPDRLLAAAAGLVASAAGAHVDASGNLTTAGTMLLVHAAALVALAAGGPLHPGLRRIAALVLVVGIVLFAGDLALRSLAGVPLFPMAAPTGGMALIAGWLLLVPAAIVGRRHD